MFSSVFSTLKKSLSAISTSSWLSWMRRPGRRSGLLDQAKSQAFGSSFDYRERTFYVFFVPSSHLMSPLLKRGFKHCFAVERLEFIWMMFDPTRAGLNIVLPDCDASHPLIENMVGLSGEAVVLEVVLKQDDSDTIFRPKFLTCVSVLEYAMGLQFGTFRAWTPYGLYKRLLECRHKNLISVRRVEDGQKSGKACYASGGDAGSSRERHQNEG